MGCSPGVETGPALKRDVYPESLVMLGVAGIRDRVATSGLLCPDSLAARFAEVDTSCCPDDAEGGFHERGCPASCVRHRSYGFTRSSLEDVEARASVTPGAIGSPLVQVNHMYPQSSVLRSGMAGANSRSVGRMRRTWDSRPSTSRTSEETPEPARRRQRSRRALRC